MIKAEQITMETARAHDGEHGRSVTVSIRGRIFAVSYTPKARTHPSEAELSAIVGTSQDLVTDLLMSA